MEKDVAVRSAGEICPLPAERSVPRRAFMWERIATNYPGPLRAALAAAGPEKR
jgi:hypothetical protein